MDQLARYRRVFRLVAVLTGRPLASASVLATLPREIPDGPRGERIAVQAARDFEYAQSSLLDASLAERFSALAPQNREAWVLRRVLCFTERDTAISMDCSRTVVRQRLETIGTSFSEDDAAAVRASMLSIGLPASFQRQHQERERARKVLLVMAVLAGIAVGIEVLRIVVSA